jgi:hypothetical protein
MITHRLLAQAEIEEGIVALSEELERQTYIYAELSDSAAEKEADFKLQSAKHLIGLIDSQVKMTAQEKQARCDWACAEAFRNWKIAEARRQACKEGLLSLRARLDAQRSLAANVRHQT